MDTSLDFLFIVGIWFLVTIAMIMFAAPSRGDNRSVWLMHLFFVVVLIVYFAFPEFWAKWTMPFRIWIQRQLK